MKSKTRKKIHKIGKHGAVYWVTQKGDICAECGKLINEINKKNKQCEIFDCKSKAEWFIYSFGSKYLVKRGQYCNKHINYMMKKNLL